MKNPETPQEWQLAVDLAEFYLLTDSAEQYGLVTGPKVNVQRCEDILARGRERGFRPRDHRTLCEEFIPALAGGLGDRS